jgi:hypothetical protein
MISQSSYDCLSHRFSACEDQKRQYNKAMKWRNRCWGLYSYGMSMDRPYLKLVEAKRSLSREAISPLVFHS